MTEPIEGRSYKLPSGNEVTITSYWPPPASNEFQRLMPGGRICMNSKGTGHYAGSCSGDWFRQHAKEIP